MTEVAYGTNEGEMLVEGESARQNDDCGKNQKHLIRCEMGSNIERISNANQSIRTHGNHTE